VARGGARPGAGRKVGSVTKKTREIAEKAVTLGVTPLEYMLSILRDESMPTESRFEAAKAAAPYVHPKLSNVELNASVSLSHEDALKQLSDG
jgi:DNA-binding ferritin-like protein